MESPSFDRLCFWRYRYSFSSWLNSHQPKYIGEKMVGFKDWESNLGSMHYWLGPVQPLSYTGQYYNTALLVRPSNHWATQANIIIHGKQPYSQSHANIIWMKVCWTFNKWIVSSSKGLYSSFLFTCWSYMNESMLNIVLFCFYSTNELCRHLRAFTQVFYSLAKVIWMKVCWTLFCFVSIQQMNTSFLFTC
jgi:hypothetical protein